jgi:hypothetical protein
MPLYVSVGIVRQGNRIFSHVFSTVAPDEATAIEQSKADYAATHPPIPDKELMGASIFAIDPKAVAEAYREANPQETIQ